MPDYPESLDQMLAIWNTTDTERQASLAASALEHNVHFVDPNHNVVGRPAFLRMVSEVQKRLAGVRYSRASHVDVQNNHCRYHWAIHRGDALVVSGFDVTEVNDGGKIVKVIGFFGDLKR